VEEKLDRYECLRYLALKLTDELVIAWQGFYEWPSLVSDRPPTHYFSSLGCTIPMATGLAIALPHRRVIALVSDGDVLMELGALPSLGRENPGNLVVFVNDNECYQTAGGYPTMTHFRTDLAAMAKGAGIEYAITLRKWEDFRHEVDQAFAKNEFPRFIVLKTNPSPFKAIYETVERAEDKYRFIRHIEATEGIRIFPSPKQDRKLVAKPD